MKRTIILTLLAVSISTTAFAIDFGAYGQAGQNAADRAQERYGSNRGSNQNREPQQVPMDVDCTIYSVCTDRRDSLNLFIDNSACHKKDYIGPATLVTEKTKYKVANLVFPDGETCDVSDIHKY
jgi:hypothetical protein